jgi:hypothetical protein
MEIAMKPTRTILAIFAAVLALPLMAAAENKEATNDEVIDDIVVIGQKSLSTLRKEVFKAEEDFYSAFNKLNDNKDFTVRCFYENATGTHIKNHVCRARYVTKAYSSHAARNGGDLSRVANQDANPAFATKTAKYQETMETLIDANPDLLAALITYNTARAEFMAEREQIASN